MQIDQAIEQELAGHGQDIYNLDTIAAEISSYTRQSEACVWKRLAKEIDQVGSNVIEEADRFGVTPHFFDDKLIDFYKESDGFIYETSVESRRSHRQKKWLNIVKYIAKKASNPAACDILLYGDSIGNDSIFIRRMGYNTFYHDYDGYCSRFAWERFRSRDLVVHKFAPGSRREFDFVICFEVAEHVPDPPALISELSSLTGPNGYCIFSESFGLLESSYPTHLMTNLKYVGKVDQMFRANGMSVEWKDEHEKPIIYTKKQTDWSERSWRMGLLARRIGRKFGRSFGSRLPKNSI